MPDRVTIDGSRTLSVEVLPDEASAMLAQPHSDAWADDYPTEGTRLTIKRLAASVSAGAWEPGFGMYTVQPVGGLICGGWAFYSKPDHDGHVEIGYGLAPSGRGQGLITDAVRAAVRWAGEQPTARTVWAGVDHDNLASIRVLEATGFIRVADHAGRFRYEVDVS